MGSAVGGPVGAKLFGTDVDQIKLWEFYSDALILSGVGKDYDGSDAFRFAQIRELHRQ